MKILMGTKNPGKIQGAKEAFEKYFDNVEIEGIPVNSDVSNQPLNEEVFQGAKNRVKNLKEYAKKNNIQADFYIASEGGIQNLLCDEWIEFNAAVIEDNNGLSSVGTSQGFPIPEKYMDEIIETELGKVMDKIFKGNELNKGKGGVSLLTHGELTRIDLTRNAFIVALTKHINGDVWR
jgi:inosine/xanthosine triphosphatase